MLAVALQHHCVPLLPPNGDISSAAVRVLFKAKLGTGNRPTVLQHAAEVQQHGAQDSQDAHSKDSDKVLHAGGMAELPAVGTSMGTSMSSNGSRSAFFP